MAKETRWTATKLDKMDGRRGTKKIGMDISNGPKKSGRTTAAEEVRTMEK